MRPHPRPHLIHLLDGVCPSYLLIKSEPTQLSGQVILSRIMCEKPEGHKGNHITITPDGKYYEFPNDWKL